MRAVPLLVLLAGCRGLLGFEEPVVIDLDAPEVNFAMATTSADEASGELAIALTLSKPSDDEVTVDFAVGGDAGPDDFAIGELAVTFAPGETTKPVTLAIQMDGEEEQDEQIELVLVAATGARLGASSAHAITIASDILPRVRFVVTSTNVLESGIASLEVALDMPSAIELAVDYQVVGGTATGAVDYTLDDLGTLIVPAGATTVSLEVPVLDDPTDEEDETVQLQLLSPSTGLVLGPQVQLELTLQDDDAPPTVRFLAASSQSGETNQTRSIDVVLGAPSAKPITVEFARSGTAQVGTDYEEVTTPPLTFAPGDTTRTIAVNIRADSIIENPDDTIVYTLTSAENATLAAPLAHTLIIVDND